MTSVGPAIPGCKYAHDMNAHVMEMKVTKAEEKVFGMGGGGGGG